MDNDHDPAPSAPTIHEIVDALLLFDEPILNHRFHALLARHPRPETKADLEALPADVVHAERAARQGAANWAQAGHLGLADEAFQARAERALLESFLTLAESQIRVFSFFAHNAPDREGRDPFDEAAQRLRDVAAVLRRAAGQSRQEDPQAPVESPIAGPTQNVEVLESSEGLRERVEEAIRRTRATQKEPRLLILSHIAYRHLRDEGCFQNRTGTLANVAASIDFGWDGVAFALLTYDAATLEEIFKNHVKI